MPTPLTTPPEQRWWLRRMANRMEVDRAVFYALLARGWQFLAGPVTIVLIGWRFTEEVQGFYYTFWSLIGLQMFFELSMPQVILTVASHEWEKLSLADDGSIAGDADARSRLASLLRTSLAFYVAAGLLFAVIVGLAGLDFFARDAAAEQVAWQAPWLVLVGLCAAALALTPLLALLEGCNQVRSVYRVQFIRSVAGNLVVWIAIPLGAALWVPAIATLVRILCELLFAGWPFRRFFRDLLRRPDGAVIDWWGEVWPYQWRLALKGIFGYFNAYLMNPVIFHYHGSVEAGRMGMTWQVLTSLQAACASWVKARAARMGVLVARRDFAELDRIFYLLSVIALAVMIAGSAFFLAIVAALDWFESPFARRLIEPAPATWLAAALAIALIADFQWTYIHAHKRAPYLFLTLFGASLNGLLIWLLGDRFGVRGVCAAYLAMNLLFHLPLWTWVWSRCRAEWHRDDPPPGDQP